MSKRDIRNKIGEICDGLLDLLEDKTKWERTSYERFKHKEHNVEIRRYGFFSVIIDAPEEMRLPPFRGRRKIRGKIIELEGDNRLRDLSFICDVIKKRYPFHTRILLGTKHYDWLKENCPDTYLRRSGTVYFYDEETAMAFKLAWE